MDELQQHIADALRMQRDYYGMPNTEIAKRTGLAKNTVTKIINGYTNPSAVQVLAVAYCLDFDELYPKPMLKTRSERKAKHLPTCMPGCLPDAPVFNMGETEVDDDDR